MLTSITLTICTHNFCCFVQKLIAAPFFVGTSALGNLNNFLPSVNISPQNMASGDYFELSSISGTGFTVHFKNSSNASIDRNFTYSAVGFGKGG